MCRVKLHFLDSLLERMPANEKLLIDIFLVRLPKRESDSDEGHAFALVSFLLSANWHMERRGSL